MGGGEEQTQSSTTTQELDPWVKQQWSNVVNQYAKPAANQPYGLFPGARIAQPNQFQTQGNQLTLDAAAGSYGQDLGKDVASNAAYGQALGPDQAMTDQYMAPYMNVVQDYTDEVSRSLAGQNTGLASAADTQGAYGGSRHALMETENNRNAMDKIGQFTNQMGYQATNDALNRTMQTQAQNAGFNLQGAGLMGQLGMAQNANDYGAAQAVGGVGNYYNNQDQRHLDLAYQDFMAQSGYPKDQLNTMLSTLGMYPNTGTSTTTGTSPQSSGGLTGAIGGGLAGLGAVGTLSNPAGWALGLGAGLGALGGAIR